MIVVEIAETIDGRWMILTNGWQTFGETDPTGCGTATYPSATAAAAAWAEHGVAGLEPIIDEPHANTDGVAL